MKLVFFSLALLLGLVLIHAAEVSNKEDHVDAHADPSAPKAQSQASPPASKSKDAEVPAADVRSDTQDKTAHDPKADSGDKKPTEHAEHTPKESDSKTTTAKSTESSTPSHTTVKPVPYPAGHASWNVTDPHTNVTCILVSGTISLTATLKNYNGLNETKTIALGPKTPAEGDCAKKYIRWLLDAFNSSLQFKFSTNESSHEVYLGQVDGQVVFGNEGKKNVTVGFQNATLKAFEAPANKSYFCGKSIELPVVERKDLQIAANLEDFHIQAFKTSKNTNFDDSIDGCPTSGGGPDVIPIVVGCALAILVVVVLVAYLINRRRSQAHGYLSM